MQACWTVRCLALPPLFFWDCMLQGFGVSEVYLTM